MPTIPSKARDAQIHLNAHTPRAPDPLLYRVSDAVQATGLCRAKIYQLIEQGELRTAHFGRSVRISAESLRDLIARRTDPPRQPPAPSETPKLLKKAAARFGRKPPAPARRALAEAAQA
jgi:excisionase family DNA binding protein